MKILLSIVGVILLCWLYAGWKYNSMVVLNEWVSTKWSQVENQYQRRYDLIPNLVNTVKGYADHEQETLTAVIEARSKATQMKVNLQDAQEFSKFQESQTQLSSALSRLMLVAEQYPDLKANQNFLDLQAQLEGTENRISFERKNFNEAVQGYNVYIKSFPTNMLAWMFGFVPKQLFESTKWSEVAPVVNFDK